MGGRVGAAQIGARDVLYYIYIYIHSPNQFPPPRLPPHTTTTHPGVCVCRERGFNGHVKIIGTPYRPRTVPPTQVLPHPARFTQTAAA